MRYRILGTRYSVVVARQPRPLGIDWHTRRVGVAIAHTRWRPPTDVYETAANIVVHVELGGVDEEDLDAALYEDAIVIEGQRRLPPCDAGALYHSAEIWQGPFRLEVVLPRPVDPDRIEARFEQGLLRITFVKLEA